MSDLIRVDVDDVSAHTSRVFRIAADVALAADATRSTNVGGGAFGVLCGFLVPPIAVATAMAGGAIHAAEAMLERSAVELRGVSAELAAFDDEAVRVLTAIDTDFG